MRACWGLVYCQVGADNVCVPLFVLSAFGFLLLIMFIFRASNDPAVLVPFALVGFIEELGVTGLLQECLNKLKRHIGIGREVVQQQGGKLGVIPPPPSFVPLW